MSSLASQDLILPAQTSAPIATWSPPAWAPAQTEASEQATPSGLSDEQRALDAAAAAEAGMGEVEVDTLDCFGLRPSELDPTAASRMAVGMKRMQALLACEGGNELGCELAGPGLVGHESWQGVGGDTSEDLVVEDEEFTLRLSTRTTADGRTERVLFYKDIDGTFLSGVSAEPVEGLSEHEAPAEQPPAPDEEGLGSFLEGAILGDFAGNDTWSAVAGQTTVGLIPIAGQIADARDTFAAVRDVAEGKDGGWARLGAAGVGWIPGIGDALKGGARVGMRLGTEVVEEGAERLVKEAAEEGGERIAKEGAEEAAETAARAVPQGIDPVAFQQAGALVRERAGHLGGEIMVQGSRASGTARPDSDMDIAILVDPDAFDALIKERFKVPNAGSAKERTMQWAEATGKIQSSEAGLRSLRLQLQEVLGVEVDLSVIRRGGPFDQPPYIPMG